MSFIDMDFYSKPLVDDESIKLNSDDALVVNAGDGLEIDGDLHIQEGGVTAEMLNDMDATNGQILKYVIPEGASTGAWTPSDSADVEVDNISIKADATSGEISVNPGEGLKVGTTALDVIYDTDLTVTAGTEKKLTHANTITEQTTEKFSTFKYDKNGHITGTTEITFDNELELTTANKLKHKTEITAQTTLKPVNVKIDKYGHISEYEDTNIEDLANVDEDTTPVAGNVLVYKNVGTEASPVMKWSPEDATVKIDNITIKENASEQIEVSLATNSGLKVVNETDNKGISAKVDDSTLEINATNGLQVKDDGITKEKLNTDVANGDKGLKLDDTTGLEVKIDDSTIDFITTTGTNKGKLEVKDEGITKAKLNENVADTDNGIELGTNGLKIKVDNSTLDIIATGTDKGKAEIKDTGVTKAKLNEDVIKTNGGLDFNNTDGLSVKINAENLNIPTTGDDAGKLEIKDKGVTNTKVKADTTSKQVLLTDTASTTAAPQSAVWGKIDADYLDDADDEDYVITTVEDGVTPVWGQVRTGGIEDKAVTYEKIDDTDAEDGDVLKYNETEEAWEPAKISENFDTTITAGSDSVAITNDAFKTDDVSFRFQFKPNAAAAGGKSEQLILKRYTLDTSTGELTLYFSKEVASNTDIRVVVNY